MKTLFLIDANSLIHRCFHALPPFKSPDGRPTGALYGLANILLKISREQKPDYAAALFDRPEPTYRDKIYPAYKAQRPKVPDELISQIIEARTLFGKFGIKALEKPGAEADDLIATLAEKFKKEPDLKIFILTSDMDSLQLVENEKIVVEALKKGISDTVLYDADEVQARFGLRPEQLIDYKALVGDPSDNIKGVSGIGPKTAAEILQKFGSLENTYQKIEKETKIGEKLLEAKKETELNKQIVRLDRQVGVRIDLKDLVFQEDKEELKKYVAELGFKKLAERLENGNLSTSSADERATAKQTEKKKSAIQGKIF